MRLYVASDLHGSARAADMIREDLTRHRPDVFVAAGDITNFGPVSYAEALFADLRVPALAVPGNCDPREMVPALDRIGVGLHGRRVKLAAHTFVGLGGANPTPFDTPFELDEETISGMLRGVMEPGAILVSHAPPRGFVDTVRSGEHVGSVSVRAIVDEFAPPLVLCGHIHEARGVARQGKTTIVNPGPAADGHRALIEIDGEIRVQLL